MESREVVGRADIAEGDADIAQEAAALGAQDRRAAEEGFELPVVEGEEFAEWLLQDVRPWPEGGVAGGAGPLIAAAAKAVGGGGGGKGDIASAGGKNPDGLPDALRLAGEAVGAALG